MRLQGDGTRKGMEKKLEGLLRLTYVGFTVARKTLSTDAVTLILTSNTRSGLAAGVRAGRANQLLDSDVRVRIQHGGTVGFDPTYFTRVR